MSNLDRLASSQVRASSSHRSLAIASRGDALTPYLFDALARRFAGIGFINPELSKPQRYRVAAISFRRNRRKWVEQFYKSGYATRLRSANAARAMKLMPHRPDLVLHVHALFTQSESPSVLYIDCTHAQSAALWPAWNPLRGRALRAWYRRERATYIAARHLFAFSEATRMSLIRDYGVDSEKITVTGAGVNFTRLPELRLTDRHHSGTAPTILFIGNDFVRKGGIVLLDAFRQVRLAVPEARLQLVGVDPVIGAQSGVEVLGRIEDRTRIAALYADAAVFVVPSFFDPFPLVALEAMSFGLPVVSTAQMGTPEMISDCLTGRLVEPGSASALADAILEVLLRPELASRMGAAARREVELRFTWDAVVARMAPVLEQLLTELDG